jgi:hypothetical protein
MTETYSFRILVIEIYLELGLPARSRFGEGRCLEFGISQQPSSRRVKIQNGGPMNSRPPLFNLFPSREGIDHIRCGKIKGIDDFELGFPLFPLILSDQTPAFDVLARRIELDPIPWHDQLVTWNV